MMRSLMNDAKTFPRVQSSLIPGAEAARALMVNSDLLRTGWRSHGHSHSLCSVTHRPDHLV